MENRICSLFGIKYPIIQAGMIWCSGWELASAVSNAGGLGIIGSGSMYPDILRDNIRKCKAATDKPFAVNVPLLYPDIDKHMAIIVEEGVNVVFTSAGSPKTWTRQLQQHGIKVVHVVSSSKFAAKVEEAGCDGVVCEGFEAGVKLIIDQQNKKGSWTYGGDKLGLPIAYNKDSGGEDLSVTGWQYQALKAAKNTGLKIAGLHAAIDKCVDYLEAKQTKDGGIGNTNRDGGYNQWNLTGTGVLGLQTLGKGGKKSVIAKGIKFLHEFITAEPLDWNKNCNLYAWYYYTQAFFQQGGDDWKFYNEQLLPNLLNNQNPDGSWKPERSNGNGVGNMEGGVYKTALCTLQLEVYYRYLKVADRDNDSFFDK